MYFFLDSSRSSQPLSLPYLPSTRPSVLSFVYSIEVPSFHEQVTWYLSAYLLLLKLCKTKRSTLYWKKENHGECLWRHLGFNRKFWNKFSLKNLNKVYNTITSFVECSLDRNFYYFRLQKYTHLLYRNVNLISKW